MSNVPKAPREQSPTNGVACVHNTYNGRLVSEIELCISRSSKLKKEITIPPKKTSFKKVCCSGGLLLVNVFLLSIRADRWELHTHVTFLDLKDKL